MRLSSRHATQKPHFKDAILDELAERANVAQFVSFGPGLPPEQRFARVHGYPRGAEFSSAAEAISALLDASVENSVNVRAFEPTQPKAHEFIYGLRRVDEVALAIDRLASSGLHTIVNETIDVNDGGVSGVSFGGVLEFAPGDTPRAVEKPGTAALPQADGLALLETVYGFRPALTHTASERLEFSLHPLRRGLRQEHTVVWELETVGSSEADAGIRWPNLFSRHLGDKAFGLLIAHIIGLPVPATTVIGRRVAPFAFGQETGSREIWIRTCPAEPVPGRFTTKRGWIDPYELLAREDPEGSQIQSVLAQEGVDAVFSGAVVAGADQSAIIEGVAGPGDDFMIGARGPEPLPLKLRQALTLLYEDVVRRLGPVRFEWVYDGSNVWIVQLHHGATATLERIIYPGIPSKVHEFEVSDGLERLRALAEQLEGSGEGIVLVGDIGVTSHFGDVLRRSKIPSQVVTPWRVVA